MNKNKSTKKSILKKSEALFAKNGFKGTSMSKIAKEVGVEKSSLYYFFENKAEIYMHILNRIIKETKNIASKWNEKPKNKFSLENMIQELINLGEEHGMIVSYEEQNGINKEADFFKKIENNFAETQSQLIKAFEKGNVQNPKKALITLFGSTQNFLKLKEQGKQTPKIREFSKYLSRVLSN